MSTVKKYFASCPKGLETQLNNEIRSQNIDKTQVGSGGVYFSSEPQKVIDVILQTRTVSRVYKELFSFKIRNKRDLYNNAVRQNWQQVFELNQTFKIHTLLDHQAKKYFKNSLHLSQVFKDGVVDQFRNMTNSRPSVDTKNAHINLLLRIESLPRQNGFRAIVHLNLCGHSLSNRGYRIKSHVAPLRENLAAGILLNTNWDPENQILIDSMCGTGTFLIEAALIKGKIPPTYLKIKEIVENNTKPFSFMFQNWFLQDSFLQDYFRNKIDNTHNYISNSLAELSKNQLFGFDTDPEAIQTANINIDKAGLKKDIIDIDEVDACSLAPIGDSPSIIICNPPYGERMGSSPELEELYFQYGENLKKNWTGHTAYIFTGSSDLRKKISLQTSKRIPLFNGNIECRLLRYDLY